MLALACQQVDATTLTTPAERDSPTDREPALSGLVELPALDDSSRPAPFLRLPASSSVMSGWSTAPVAPHLTFDTPVFVAEAPGTGRLFVIEREGRIFSVDVHAPDTEKRLVLDLSHVTQGHGDLGMLGLAFHPDFGRAGSPHAGSIFVHYAHSDHPQPDPIDVSAPSRWRLVRVELERV